MLTLLLCACAGGPVDGERSARLALQTLANPDAATPEHTIRGADGQPLALSVWEADNPKADNPEADNPKAVILALHGYADYGPSTYDKAARYWTGRGLTVYAYDHRGFGRNASRGRWPGAEALIADLAAIHRQIADRHPGAPLYVVGHSMGGGLALAAAGEGLLDRAAGLALAAPAVHGGPHLPTPHRMLAWSMALVFSDHRFTGEGFVRIRASDNLEMLRALGRDPLYVRPTSPREILGLVRVMDRAVAAAPSVDLPPLMLIGRKDELIPRKPLGAVFRSLPGPKRRIAYEDGWHMLFRDLQAENVWRDVADWALGAPKAN
jgi:alpha-beta hydrolase superfamily lysophospholipase